MTETDRDDDTNGLLVIKIGGGAELDLDALWDDLAALHQNGRRFVLVHGGNAALTALQERLGQPPRFVENGRGGVSRYTDAETMELFSMVYAGQMNVRHVCGLRARGVNALGLTGVDGGLLVGERQPALRCIEDGKKKVLRDDHTGTLTRVNAPLLELLLDQGYVPIVTVPAYAEGPEGAGGVPINVDGDTATLRIAMALGASELVFLSDVPGLLRDIEDRDSLISEIQTPEAWWDAEQVARGRFRRKLEAVREAVANGVGTVVIASGSVARPVSQALEGSGSHFRDPGHHVDSVEEVTR